MVFLDLGAAVPLKSHLNGQSKVSGQQLRRFKKERLKIGPFDLCCKISGFFFPSVPLVAQGSHRMYKIRYRFFSTNG